MMKVTKHSSDPGHPISSEDVIVLHKNTLYMDHLIKVTNVPATPWQFQRCEIQS